MNKDKVFFFFYSFHKKFETLHYFSRYLLSYARAQGYKFHFRVPMHTNCLSEDRKITQACRRIVATCLNICTCMLLNYCLLSLIFNCCVMFTFTALVYQRVRPGLFDSD